MAINANGRDGNRIIIRHQDRLAQDWDVKKAFAEKEAFGYGCGGPNRTGYPRIGANGTAGLGYIKKKGRVTGVEGMAAGVSAGVNGGLKGGVGVGADGIVNCIDNLDRPGNAFSTGTYQGTDVYAHGGFTDKTGERVPKAGAWAGAGVGLARAEWSVFDAEAKGPNASAEASATVLGAGAIARAEVGSVSATAGPVRASLGLGVDTGVNIGVDGVELKLLGTGVKLGPKPSIALLGSELECSIM